MSARLSSAASDVIEVSYCGFVKKYFTTEDTKITKNEFWCFAPKIISSFVLFAIFVVKFLSHFDCGSAALGSSW